VRTIRPIIAAVIVSAVPSILAIGNAPAQGTMAVTDDSAMMHTDVSGDACGCRNVRQPAWHGNVHGTDCRPSCPRCGVFHADPCAQLNPHRHLHHGVPMVLPPCFPRLHAWCSEGFMPTPRPLVVPRCHQCGAVIEGGF
jgi:hypothetical protein